MNSITGQVIHIQHGLEQCTLFYKPLRNRKKNGKILQQLMRNAH